MHTNNTVAASGFGFRPRLSNQQPDQNGNWLGLIFLGMWLIVVVDGLWTYTMAKLAGGHRLPLTPFVWLVLYLGVFFSVFVDRKFIVRLPISIWVAAISFVLYMPVALIFQVNTESIGFGPALHGYYVYYFFLIIFPIFGTFAGSLNRRLAAFVMIFLGCLLAIFGSVQHFSHNLFEIGRVVSEESNAFNLGFHGRTRANGFFAHSEDLGHFLSMVAGIVFAHLLDSKKFLGRVFYILVLVLLALGTYATLTRSAYIAFVATLFAVIFMTKKRNSKVNWLPVILMLFGFVILFGRSILSDFLSVYFNTDIFSSSSLDDRLSGVYYYLSILNRDGVLAWFFGKGWVLFASREAIVAIDNGFLAIILSLGVIGFSLWLWMTWVIWRYLVSVYFIDRSPLVGGLVATYSIWLLLSVFGVVNLYQFAAMLVVPCVSVLNFKAK